MDSSIIIPRRVLEEIRRGRLSENIMAVEEFLEVRDPSDISRSNVKKAAEKTGDMEKLSETDIDVIAMAMDTGGEVYSDDYSVLNVCNFLNIPCSSHGQAGIKAVVEWVWQCSGCRKIYRHFRGSCAICGHQLRRRRRSEKVLRHP